MMEKFDESLLQGLNTETWGSITIIGGSHLFHGAPLLALKVASREANEVFFATPEKSVGLTAEKIKSELFSFIWIPWEEVEVYIKKSHSILIGPGFMRSKSEENVLSSGETDESWKFSKIITEGLLSKHKDKKWVIDAGSLQVMSPSFIPPKAIITPNKHEYKSLFDIKNPKEVSKEFDCVILIKGVKDEIYYHDKAVEVEGGNIGMAKGGTGDTLAGLTTALYSKNDPFLSAIAASYINKKAGDLLYKEKGEHFNADDLVNKLPEVLKNY